MINYKQQKKYNKLKKKKKKDEVFPIWNTSWPCLKVKHYFELHEGKITLKGMLFIILDLLYHQINQNLVN